jgi:hypothetical protein
LKAEWGIGSGNSEWGIKKGEAESSKLKAKEVGGAF